MHPCIFFNPDVFSLLMQTLAPSLERRIGVGHEFSKARLPMGEYLVVTMLYIPGR